MSGGLSRNVKSNDTGIRPQPCISLVVVAVLASIMIAHHSSELVLVMRIVWWVEEGTTSPGGFLSFRVIVSRVSPQIWILICFSPPIMLT